MKTRIITAVVGLGVLAVVLAFFDTFLFDLVLSAICLLAIHEVFSAMGFGKKQWYLYVGAVPLTLLVMLSSSQMVRGLLLPVAFLTVLFYNVCQITHVQTLDYGKLCRVCDLIRTGKPYIATHPDFNCPTEHGFIPDLGAFMALIHASTGRWADVVIGKPNRGIVDEALARTGFALHEMAMVGDRLYTDVATGVNHGMTGILVLSGEAKRSDVDTSDVKPDLVFGRLSDIIPYL